MGRGDGGRDFRGGERVEGNRGWQGDPGEQNPGFQLFKFEGKSRL
jgi:hypothetical protein